MRARSRISKMSVILKGKQEAHGKKVHVPNVLTGLNLRTKTVKWASLVDQLVKNLPAVWETWVRCPGWEDSPGEVIRLPTPVFWPGELHGLYSPWGCKGSDTTE